MRVLILLVAVLLSACATTQKMNSLHVGMTKQEVISTLGTPDSTSANGEAEYLRYTLLKPFHGELPYFVRIRNGEVDAYGRVGDFGTTNQPIEANITVTQE